jgi:hypothetical protein
VVYNCNPRYSEGRGKKISNSGPAQAKLEAISQKQNESKRARRVT